MKRDRDAMRPPGAPFTAVSAWVVRREGAKARYLLLRRSAEYLKGNWQMVVGRPDGRECAVETVLREIREETGFHPAALYNSAEAEVFYEARSGGVAVVPAFVAFVDRKEVTLSPDEHDAYEWLSFEEALGRLEFPQQKRILRSVHENFVLSEPNERLRIDTDAL